ncbi:MAG: ATP-binding cassette domain-containing protein [Erysipelotrichaceae bacterium]|nr:ATP-binding cassette domain-containing protein [Erysipelotrichaceae bacterium]
MTPIIQINHLTKDYGDQRGIFDINLEINQGEVWGYIGINGAGKTTTIRNLMGFVKPTNGNCSILDYDCWKDATVIKNHVSYIPGEISFPSLSSGSEFLKLQADYLNIKDYTYMNKLISMLQLDPTADLKRMSKGMKQKTAIVAALMGHKDILILDEPTTGLDPLMRNTFIDLMLEEKKQGKTIFMSSHIFSEIETLCDKAAIIKDGHVIDIVDINQLKNGNLKTFTIRFNKQEDFDNFIQLYDVRISATNAMQCSIDIFKDQISDLFKNLSIYSIQSLEEQHLTLEDYFTNVYKEVQING